MISWKTIHSLIDACELETIGGIKKADLALTAQNMEANWKDINIRHIKAGIDFHLRPSDVNWKLPHAIEIDRENIYVIGKEILAKNSTFKIVKLAVHLNTLQPVVHATVSYETHPDFIEKMMIREIGFLYKLHKEDTVVKILHSCQYRKKKNNPVKKMGITLEYCTQKDLFDLDKKLLSKNIFSFVHDMCLILDMLYREKIVHGDIKPENLFVTEIEGKLRLKLGDFGLASDEKIPSIGATLEYAAPEYTKRCQTSHKMDVWSMGISLFVMLFGIYPEDPPLKGLTGKDLCLKEVKEDPKLTHLIEILDKMLVKDPLNRLSGPELLRMCCSGQSFGNSLP